MTVSLKLFWSPWSLRFKVSTGRATRLYFAQTCIAAVSCLVESSPWSLTQRYMFPGARGGPSGVRKRLARSVCSLNGVSRASPKTQSCCSHSLSLQLGLQEGPERLLSCLLHLNTLRRPGGCQARCATCPGRLVQHPQALREAAGLRNTPCSQTRVRMGEYLPDLWLRGAQTVGQGCNAGDGDNHALLPATGFQSTVLGPGLENRKKDCPSES